MEERKWPVSQRTAALLFAGLFVAAVAAVLLGLAFSGTFSSDGSRLPPPLPPLTDLPQGRGLDWSSAGYAEGTEALPTPADTYNVSEYGAVGDGETDDTKALKDALAAAQDSGNGGMVYLPPGTYLLREPLQIDQPNILLRGAGEDKTTIYVPLSLADVYPGTWKEKADGTVESPWKTRGGFISFVGRKQKSSDKSVLLAEVDGAVDFGETVIPVTSTKRFRLGQWVRLALNDASTEGAGASDDSSEEGGPSQSGSAPRGSIAAYVYGDGLADSGAPGTFGSEDFSFSARVASIGMGWVAIDRSLPFPVRANWTCVLQRYEPSLQKSGVEELTLMFKHTWMRPHLTERGYNGIEVDGAANMWISRVTVLNADNAVKMRSVDHSTVAHVTVGVTEPRWQSQSGGKVEEMNGHHALSVARGHANHVTRFRVAAPFYHDVSLEAGALLNVISSGWGYDLNLDLHRRGPFGNLFTAIDFGQGSRPFGSGGRQDRGAHAGRQNTFWNLQAGGSGDDFEALDVAPAPTLAPAPAPAQAGKSRRLLWQSWRRRKLADGPEAAPLELPPCDFGPLLNFVGRFVGGRCNDTGWLVGGLPGDKPNLYRSQVQTRSSTQRTPT